MSAETQEEADRRLFGTMGKDGWLLYNSVLGKLIESGWLAREDNELGEPEFVFAALDALIVAASVPARTHNEARDDWG